MRAINDRGGITSLQLHHERKNRKKSRSEICQKQSGIHTGRARHNKHGWVESWNTHKNKKNHTNKFNTHFTKTHYKQTLECNERARNVQGFLAAEWWMQQRCYFWRGMKTYFSALLMMLICSQSPNMQMKCATTIKRIVLRRWGRFKQHVCKTETAHNFVTCAALCVRALSRSLANHHSTRSQVWAWCLGWYF